MNLSKKKQSLQKAKKDHDLFLNRMGVTKNDIKQKLYQNGKRIAVNDIPNYSTQKVELSHSVTNGFKKERPKYTGDLIMGIATTHKSNIVPVMRGTNQAEEIAKMRRN